MKWYFVSANAGQSKKDGRAYNFVTLSNGLRAVTVNNGLNLDTTGLVEGDKLDVDFKLEINYKNELAPTLTKLQKAK